MKDEKDAYEGEWDFDGSCAPPETGRGPARDGMETFSLGCFGWVRRGKDGQGRGLKKGKVTYHVKGVVSGPAEAYTGLLREEKRAGGRNGLIFCCDAAYFLHRSISSEAPDDAKDHDRPK